MSQEDLSDSPDLKLRCGCIACGATWSGPDPPQAKPDTPCCPLCGGPKKRRIPYFKVDQEERIY